MVTKDFIFYIGFLFAVMLLSISFFFLPTYFWILFPLSLFLLTMYSWLFENQQVKKLLLSHWFLSLASGLILYLFFAFGNWLIKISGIPLMDQLQTLYALVKPTDWLHYVWLFIIIIPGEEWFWRGFIVKRLSKKTTLYKAAFIGTFLYGSAHFVAGSLLLVLAALLGGFLWSILYLKTRNILVPIISHLFFDVLLLILFPLV
ncbi:CPBP family intramembrane glutamic endopeptidase [Halalkalibacter alkaliphilus]|uniref:CPBP family intramembrane metalloprotease n=1 Tax=Halalkalibacter alkaliphilus TaxID=2917993 RepID=A0A9X2I3B0_9BACI|nr:CPBP family intramembrane glutamic endopeptidase [Halalkalibacter alkaliphilus]MCL7747142.1 CPBP family intramembrane metalloprotease [Halalkalibacter alkaliphilus]